MEVDSAGVYAAAHLGGRAIRGSTPAVVVVDMQKGFTDPAHPLGVENATLVGRIVEILEVARSVAVPIYFTVISYPPVWTPTPWFEKMPKLATLTEGSVWTQLDERLERRNTELVVVKHHASAVFQTGLVDRMSTEGVDTVVVAGVTTSGCVRATTVDLVSSGFRVLVPHDAVGDRLSAPHQAALFDIDAKYADVVSSGEVIRYLLGAGDHEPSPDTRGVSSSEREH